MPAIILAEAGKVLRTQGVHGTLHLLVEHNIQELSPGEALFLSLQGDKVPYFIESCEEIGDGEWLVKLEELDSKETARVYTGKPFWVLAEKATAPLESQSSLEGWQVIDQHGQAIGPVTAVTDMGEYLLLSVLYRGREVLIPFHENLVQDVREAEQTLVLLLAEGLLDEEV